MLDLIQDKKPTLNLKSFDSYDAYLRFMQSHFDFTDDEYRLLFNVLVKLENVGQDPLQAIHECKFKMETSDCMEMLRFMMAIENMDL
jgi:hypothetical protein